MRVVREIDIDASADEIYAVIMDPQRLEDWVSIHQKLLAAPRGQLRKGSKLSQSLKLAGREFNVDWEVVENRKGQRVVWEGRGPVRSKAKVIYEFEPGDGNGTHFVYANEYDLPGGPLGKMAGPMVRRVTAGELDKSLALLRTIVER